MLLIKDVAIEKPEHTLDLAQESSWFGCRVGKLNINQTGLLTDSEKKGAWSGLVTWIAGIPTVQVQPSSLFTTSPEWKTQEELTLSIYGVREYQWSSNKVGYTAGAAYTIGAEITVADTGAVSFVSAVGETFSVGCTVVGALNDEIELPESMERRLDKISRLPEKWDSYSASRISGKAIEKAKSLLVEAVIHCGVSVLEEAFIAPCSDGGIQLEWNSESDKELILKILPSGEQGKYFFVESSRGGNITEKEGTIRRPEDLKPLLDKLCDSKESR